MEKDSYNFEGYSYRSPKDPDSGEKYISLGKTVIAVVGLVYLVIAAQLFFVGVYVAIDRYIVKDPEFQDDKTKKKIFTYLIISIISIVLFVIFTKYILPEPIHLFY